MWHCCCYSEFAFLFLDLLLIDFYIVAMGRALFLNSGLPVPSTLFTDILSFHHKTPRKVHRGTHSPHIVLQRPDLTSDSQPPIASHSLSCGAARASACGRGPAPTMSEPRRMGGISSSRCHASSAAGRWVAVNVGLALSTLYHLCVFSQGEVMSFL